ncbi:MAG TPA: universal stress protein [Bryobacteraceae bacterium]|nr:universal stress protein [Bryobacteraceae bacterium]
MSEPVDALDSATAQAQPRGRLKVFLGYAAGVGKTYQMLDEAQELRRKGVDVVVGYFEPHGRQDTIAKTEALEFVPRRKIEYRGAVFEEMDVDAVLRRKPAVCLVDEFAHTNVPGSKRLKRWEDVQVLLQAGIDVFTTLNVQHLESLNDEVWHITGVRVRETVPDWVVDAADEVVLVDLTAEALQNRLHRGVVYSADKAKKAMENFFTETNLTALREMALRHTAHEVEGRLTDLSTPARGAPHTARPGTEPPARHERILICLTERPSTAVLIRRGKRVADYLHADCLALHVQRNSAHGGPRTPSGALEKHLSFARNLHIETHVLRGKDVARTIVDFAREQNITQIFLGRAGGQAFWRGVGSTVHKVVRLAREREITVVAERRHQSGGRL